MVKTATPFIFENFFELRLLNAMLNKNNNVNELFIEIEKENHSKDQQKAVGSNPFGKKMSIIGLCMASITFGDHINSMLLADVLATTIANTPCFVRLPG